MPVCRASLDDFDGSRSARCILNKGRFDLQDVGIFIDDIGFGNIGGGRLRWLSQIPMEKR